jgi:hypothetical protein
MSFVDYLNQLPNSFKSKLPGDLLMENDWKPENRNFLTGNKFIFVLNRVPTVSFFCQRVNIPSIGFGQTPQANPRSVNIVRPGTQLLYEDLQVGFSVDEEMKNWLEIHNWLVNLSTFTGNNERLPEEQKISTAGIYVLSSSYKPILTVKFSNVYPISLSGLDFDVSIQDVDVLQATATFSYTHYEIIQGANF